MPRGYSLDETPVNAQRIREHVRDDAWIREFLSRARIGRIATRWDDQPFIMPTLDSKLRHDLNHFFRINEITVDVVIETQDTSIQKLLGNEGMGLIPLPDFAGRELVKEGKLIKIGSLQGVTEDFWLVSSPRKFSNPIAETLMKDFEWKA